MTTAIEDITNAERDAALELDDFGSRWAVLITGTDANLEQLQKNTFHDWVSGGLEWFDRRASTWRCFYWFSGATEVKEANKTISQLIDSCRRADVTLQLLCESTGFSTYPVLHMCSTGEKWERPGEPN